jgi:hypothetical protein
MTNPHLSERTSAGGAADVGVEWDRGNDQWWDWYMSLADGGAVEGPLVDVAAHDPGPLPPDAEVTAEPGRAPGSAGPPPAPSPPRGRPCSPSVGGRARSPRPQPATTGSCR